jgi:hypothetical protein
MKPSELSLASGTPERALITSRAETHEAVLIALRIAERWVRCLHRDLGVFDLGSVAAEEQLSRLLLSHRSARLQLLVDDATWLNTRAPRLRALQRRFSHALEMRVASEDDPVGDDAWVLIDDHSSIELKPTATARGDLWTHNKPRVQPLLASFARRWDGAGHNLAVVPLGLG